MADFERPLHEAPRRMPLHHADVISRRQDRRNFRGQFVEERRLFTQNGARIVRFLDVVDAAGAAAVAGFRSELPRIPGGIQHGGGNGRPLSVDQMTRQIDIDAIGTGVLRPRLHAKFVKEAQDILHTGDAGQRLRQRQTAFALETNFRWANRTQVLHEPIRSVRS